VIRDEGKLLKHVGSPINAFFKRVFSSYFLYYHVFVKGHNVLQNCLVCKFSFQGLAMSYDDSVP
jgi:hypothetical protein